MKGKVLQVSDVSAPISRRLASVVLSILTSLILNATALGAATRLEQSSGQCDRLRSAYERALRLVHSPAIQRSKAAAIDLFVSTYKDWPLVPRTTAREGVRGAIDALAFTAALRAVNSDPAAPLPLRSIMPAHFSDGLAIPDSRMGADNADTVYTLIPVDGNYRYRMSGQWGKSAPTDFNISVIADVNTQEQLNVVGKADIVADGTGRFTIIIDHDPTLSATALGNDTVAADSSRTLHLQVPVNARALIVRDTLSNWATETPTLLTIKRTDHAPAFDATRNGAQAQLAAFLFQDAVRLWTNILKTVFKPEDRNKLKPPVFPLEKSSGVLKNQMRTDTSFLLADDEALLLVLHPGNAAYASIGLTDAWGVTIDPERQPSSLNFSQAVHNPDKSMTAVVSVMDPGTRNWIGTGGLHFGLLAVRWQNLSPGIASGTVDMRLVRLADLDRLVPPEISTLSPDERDAESKARRATFMRRFRQCPAHATKNR